MPFLIDGYNLLNVAAVPVPARGKANLEKARLALLNFLAESLDPDDVLRTVVVFDAHDPPWGLPRETRHKGLVVRFAAQEEDADSLIEELILADSAPRQLTVVSSDHRIQRAASAAAPGRWIAMYGMRRSCGHVRNATQQPLKDPNVRPVLCWKKTCSFGCGSLAWMRRSPLARNANDSYSLISRITGPYPAAKGPIAQAPRARPA